VERLHPGALASQWVPIDPELWKPERYLDFLEARKALLAAATNKVLDELAHGTLHHAEMAPSEVLPAAVEGAVAPSVPGSIETPEEEAMLVALNEWVMGFGLPEGKIE